MANSTYSSWSNMRIRCLNPDYPNYHNYGGRGITICSEWIESFQTFLDDMGFRPENTSLDRVDNSKGYFKENCRWATRTEQALNTRIYKTNTSGVKGVKYEGKLSRWVASAGGNVRVTLYRGKDFFEACCARKSWELQNV